MAKSTAYQDRYNAGASRIVGAGVLRMTADEWRRTGELVAHRVSQVSHLQHECMRGWTASRMTVTRAE